MRNRATRLCLACLASDIEIRSAKVLHMTLGFHWFKASVDGRDKQSPHSEQSFRIRKRRKVQLPTHESVHARHFNATMSQSFRSVAWQQSMILRNSVRENISAIRIHIIPFIHFLTDSFD
jgi:hypothetical protein